MRVRCIFCIFKTKYLEIKKKKSGTSIKIWNSGFPENLRWFDSSGLLLLREGKPGVGEQSVPTLVPPHFRGHKGPQGCLHLKCGWYLQSDIM